VGSRIVALVVFAALVIVGGFANALWFPANAAPSSTVRVDVSTLARGQVRTVTAPTLDTQSFFLVRTRGGRVLALSRRTPDVGCRLDRVDDRTTNVYRAGLARWTFEDVCSGSKFVLDGHCIDGPCRHGLNRYAVRIDGGTALVDTSRVTEGPKRDREVSWQIGTDQFTVLPLPAT
jgi:nitrite reductase/ring-hydroxylating ferredoxin subunit